MAAFCSALLDEHNRDAWTRSAAERQVSSGIQGKRSGRTNICGASKIVDLIYEKFFLSGVAMVTGEVGPGENRLGGGR